MDIPGNIGKRIGILGGTFDPVHNAHLALAEAVKKEFQLDAVLFIPAALPPHKQQITTPFEHRAAMIECALNGRPGFYLSRLEGCRSGPSFSIDTLRTLRNFFGEEVLFFFIVGMDAFAEIATWREYRQFPLYVSFVVVNRPGAGNEIIADIVRRDFPEFSRENYSDVWSAQQLSGKIIFFNFPSLPISSTAIRENAGSKGVDQIGQVPEKVKSYIAKHGLYRN